MDSSTALASSATPMSPRESGSVTSGVVTSLAVRACRNTMRRVVGCVFGGAGAAAVCCFWAAATAAAASSSVTICTDAHAAYIVHLVMRTYSFFISYDMHHCGCGLWYIWYVRPIVQVPIEDEYLECMSTSLQP
jgi:hypothetical protein